MSTGEDMFPGMPDALAKRPPKAREYEALTLGEAIAKSHALLDEVQERFAPNKLLLLFSGGNDSSLLAHIVRHRMDAAVHIRTTISVPQTAEYVRGVCAAWDLPVIWADPPRSYEDLVLGDVAPTTSRGKLATVWRGFPGPAAHAIMYQRLKERALDAVRRSLTIPRGPRGQIAYVAGTRWSESDRRHRNASEIDPAGSVVWVSPIVHWTEGHLREYRTRYRCSLNHQHEPHRLCADDSLPWSEVSQHLHMSGDCLCGAYAKPGELDEIAFFYPDVADQIRAIEAKAGERGIPWCKWGAGKEAAQRVDAPGRLCSSCAQIPGQTDLIEQWAADGLLTPERARALGAEVFPDGSPTEPHGGEA